MGGRVSHSVLVEGIHNYNLCGLLCACLSLQLHQLIYEFFLAQPNRSFKVTSCKGMRIGGKFLAAMLHQGMNYRYFLRQGPRVALLVHCALLSVLYTT
jgi:hypothetical protein